MKEQIERDKQVFHELSSFVSQLLIRREGILRETASSSGATHVPSQPSTIPSPRNTHCRDSGLPRNPRNIMGTSGNVFERPFAQEGQHSTLFNNSKNLASSSQKKQGPDAEGISEKSESEMRREPQHSSILVLRF